jgi:hypothetical protein
MISTLAAKPHNLDIGVGSMNDDLNHNDGTISLDARREANRPAYSWLTDTRVTRCGKAPVRMAVAYLLNELRVHPETLELGAPGFAIFPIERSLLENNNMPADKYRLDVNTAMFKIIGMYPMFSVLYGDEKGEKAWLIYIL